jgi:GTP-binding protein Era
MAEGSPLDAPYRAGAVAILGRPNAGKSTLLNHLVGERLAIVTDKPQTTRSRILGIVTRDTAQLLLYDTPGLHASEKPLNAALNELVENAVQDCDVGLLLVDPFGGWGDDHEGLLERLASRACPVVVAATKSDVANRDFAVIERAVPAGVSVRSISARNGSGVPELLTELESKLPESPPLFPEDQLSDRPMRFLVAELVREAAFETLSQELPYSLAVEVFQYDERRPEMIRIRANLIVERATQKQIVIGKGGQSIKRIGIRARHNIEKLVGSRVHLDLWVKVEPKWAKRPKRLRSLGYS